MACCIAMPLPHNWRTVGDLDKAVWLNGDQAPVKCYGLGGRQVRTDEKFGNIFDHHSVVYEYEDGAKLFSNTRQMRGCKNDMSAQVIGSKGRASLTHAAVAHRGQRRIFFANAPPQDLQRRDTERPVPGLPRPARPRSEQETTRSP